MTKLEKAKKYLMDKGINTKIKNNKLYVVVNGYDDEYFLELSQEEIDYRADLYEENLEYIEPEEIKVLTISNSVTVNSQDTDVETRSNIEAEFKTKNKTIEGSIEIKIEKDYLNIVDYNIQIKLENGFALEEDIEDCLISILENIVHNKEKLLNEDNVDLLTNQLNKELRKCY